MADVEQTHKMVPLITCEISFGQKVSELVFGVIMFDLDLGVHIDSVKQPTWRNSVSSWHESHCWTSSFDDHLFSQLRCLRKCTTMIFSERCAFERTWSTLDGSTFWSNTCLIFGVLWVSSPVSRVLAWVGFGILWVVPSTSMTKYQKSSASKPSIRKPASNDMISDSVELWDTDVCFLHIQLFGANVRLPKMHKTPPDASRSPAKSESWKNPNRQCWAAMPTWQYWR